MYFTGKINIKNIHLIVYDFDGVMTNNKVILSEEGKESVVVHRGDGMAISEIKKLGIPQLILSTEKNPVTQKRAEKLDIPALTGIKDKRKALISYCKKNNADPKKVIYLGNDINDLEAMFEAGYPIAPHDAHDSVKKIAVIVTKKKGGEGVIRELYDILIKGL